MKPSAVLLCAVLLMPFCSFSQGGSCATPIPIPLDEICRAYTISSSTGGNAVCSNNDFPTGNSPITYFSVTSNSSADNILLSITGPDSSPVEVAMYTNGTCTNPNLQSESSLCLFDGNGLWAPAETFTITPNTTYILRIKTSITGAIQICGQNYTPPNNNCLGATPLGPALVNDNNACHKPGSSSGIVPGQLCASTLENTAFYTYTVESTGVTALSIENATCDNGNGVNSVGFQIGFFTGDCSSLAYFQCYAGFGSSMQANTNELAAGTKIYVAVDGIGGSNCSYSLRALNAVVLSANLKYFSAWKTPEGNILKWVSLQEYGNGRFEIQRSVDNINYSTIGHIAGNLNSQTEKRYQFLDASPITRCYYRLKMVNTNGKFNYSSIIQVNRSNISNPQILFNNNVTDVLNLQIADLQSRELSVTIIDNSGRNIKAQNVKINSGENNIKINTGPIPAGLYYLIVSGNNYRKTFPFLKSN